MRPPLAPPRLSLPRNDEADAQAVETSCGTDRPEARTCPLRAATSAASDELVVHRRNRVLPDQRLGRHLGPEVAHDRAHVAVGQLEPGASKGVSERTLVLHEAPRDLLVDRVEAEREVGRQHHRGAALRRVVRVGDRTRGRAALWLPLVRASGALGQLPLVTEQDAEEAVVPGDRRFSPDDLETAGDRVVAHAAAEGALPAEPLLLERGGLGVGADVVVGPGAVGLAEGVTAGDQRDRLLVVHRHPAERLTDIPGRGERVRVAVRALRVDVDQAHLDRGQWVLELAVTGVALVVQPGGLGAPVDVVVRLPDILATAAEAEGLKAHRLQGNVAGEDHQVPPRDLLAVLLLDRPQQPAGLVQADVVRPAVQRREALLAGPGAAPAVADPVGAREVPRHTDHQRAVVAEVRRPPVLGVRQHGRDVALHGGKIEGLERVGVVELVAQRVGHGGVLREDLQVEPVRPPLAVGVALGGVHQAVYNRASAGLGGSGLGSRALGDCWVVILGQGESFPG